MSGKRESKRRTAAHASEPVDLVCDETDRRNRELITPALTLLNAAQQADDEEVDPLVGTVLAAKYEIHALCGRGGMGIVYKAQHFDLKRYVAVKVLHKHLLSHQGISDRFRASAQAAHALRHPNLVSVTDFGYTEEGQFFLAMDYVHGETLTRKLKREQELTIDSFFKIFSQVLAGLKFCHQKGIVHRDIKPSNILITNKEIKPDSIKLVDFGIAKVLPESESSIDHLTQTGELLGSPLYMSPEQCRGADIDARTDLYSLGCVMFEALSGKPPFQGKSAIETLMMQCSNPTPTLYEATGDAQLTEQLDAFIKKAMSKDREDRFHNAEEMEAALMSIQRFLHLPKIARQRLNPSTQTGTSSQSVQASPAPAQRRASLVAVALVTLVICTVLAIAGKQALTNSPAFFDAQRVALAASKEQALDTIKLGVVERHEGDLGASNKRLTKAVNETRSAFGAASLEHMTALTELAATHIAQVEAGEEVRAAAQINPRYREPENTLLSTIAGCQRLRENDSADVTAIKLTEAKATFNLAHIFVKEGAYAKAKPLFEKGFTLVDAIKPIDESNNWFYRDYADFLWRTGRERDAAKLELTFHLDPWEAKLASEAPLTTTDLKGFWSEHNIVAQFYESGDKVKGSHCVVAKNGTRIDGTINDASPTIEGAMENGIFRGIAKSTYGGEVEVVMVRIDRYIVWKVLNTVKSGESYLPETAVMVLSQRPKTVQ
jgi:serine/threonine protein kinase